jgi:tetratricopeptide (TPR) repeat protein
MKHITTILVLLAVLVLGLLLRPGGESSTGESAPLFDNLGTHRHSITTQSNLAQQYFNQGLILTYAFNHEEAYRSFREAARLDPECAMCYWGAALVLGPNINAPMLEEDVATAYELTQKALQLAPKAKAQERAYIEALAKRYSDSPLPDRLLLDIAYADAMRNLAKRFPDDLDAATLFAEALMDVTPWDYWTPDGRPTTYTEEIVATLESVLARNPNHPGANHYYIHAVEASQDPGRAVPSAERLAQLVPGAGHLVHMPAHIFWRVGRYHEAAVANEHAIHADEIYMPDRRISGWYPLAYYPHNIHFLFAAAAMEGRSNLALWAARKLVSEIPEQRYDDYPMMEDFRPMPLFALVRFGDWNEVLREPRPAAKYRYTTGMWHYARGLAFVRLGRPDEAAKEYAQLEEIAALPEMEALILYSFSPASVMLQIASLILAGELAGARGQAEEMIARLEEAVAIQDSLAYIEPPPWYYPVRQTWGAALLELGHAEEAEVVYREDLRQYPHNGWSLFGLMMSLQAQGKQTEAAEVEAQFQKAWVWADVTLTASRF